MLGEYVTNKDGVISIDFVKELGLKHGDKITIEEVSVPDNYYIDKNNNKVTIILEYDKVNEVVLKNERIFGKINITKKSFDYNPYTGKDKDSLLEGCEFEIYDEKMNFIEKITTNKDGVAESGKLYKGKYFVKEVKTDEFYILDTQIYEVNIKEYNSVENLVIYNKSKKKELPKTGF